MSKQIDERVVEMRFDNKQFESNVKTSMSTLDKLKQKLQLKDASKGLDNLGEAARKVDINPLGKAAETVTAKFSALQVMGVTALANITNSAVNAGKNLVKAFTIDPIKTGFQEYETQINAVQTILANTESKGSTLQDVNNALAELNTYADKTIYNFTEMTRNIGTFTAAGVDLKTSVSAIKGIANLAAVSGSTSQQASTAMYQLSQALASGTVKLMDWNSVVNAGMGGQVFQDALKETARVHGVAIDSMIKKEGSFRETLQNGWLTSEILTETLNNFTLAAEEGSAEWENYKKSLMDKGYAEEQAVAILKMANTATDAATKVKTFTQLMDTLKEAAQSGWTKSWEIMIGDFEEAKNFLTDVSDRLGEMIGNSADSRNKMLSEGLSSGWKQLLNAGIADEEGFKETFKSVADSHGTSIDTMIAAEKKLDDSLTDSEAFQKALKKGFDEGKLSSDMLSKSVHKMADKMSNMSAKELEAAGYTADHVKQIKDLSDGLKDGSISMDEFVQKMTRTSGRENIIQALWNSFDGLMNIINPIKEAFRDIFPATTGEQLYSFTERLVTLTAKFKEFTGKYAPQIKSTFKGLFSIIKIGTTIIKSIISGITQLVGKITGLSGGILDITGSLGDWISGIAKSINETNLFGKAINGIVGFLGKGIDKIKEFAGVIKDKFDTSGFETFFNIMKSVWEIIQKIGTAVGTAFAGIGKALANAFRNGDAKSLLDILNGGLFTTILLGIKKYITGITDKFDDAVGFIDRIKGILSSVEDSLKSWQQNLKAGTLIKIAAAIGILAASLWVLSSIEPDKLTLSLGAITLLFVDLMGAMGSFEKITAKSKGMTKATTTLIGISISVLILASAMKKLSDLDWGQIGRGLTGVLGLMTIVVGAAKILSTDAKKVKKGAMQMVIMAAALKILASVCEDLSKLSWNGLAKGVSGITGILLSFAGFQALMKKIQPEKMLRSALSFAVIGIAMEIFADVCSKFGKMNWPDLGKAGAAIAGILLIAAGFGKLSSYSGKMISSSIALVIIGASMEIFADVCNKFGQMKWQDLGKAGVAIAGLLALASGFVLLSGMANGILKSVAAITIIAVAMEIFADVCAKFGQMDWEQLGKAGAAIGGILALAAGFSLLAGLSNGMWKSAAALLIMAAALAIFTPILTTLGNMSWGEIVKGLVAIAGAFTIIGIAGAVLGPLVPVILGLSGAIALLGIGCLAAGVGVMAFAAGFTALAAAGAAGATAFVAAITVIIVGLLELIPSIVNELTAAIVAICNVIIQSAPAIGEAIKALVLTAIDVLVQCIPQLADGLLQVLVGVMTSLVEYTPQLVDLLVQLLINIINGITERLPELVSVMSNFIVTLINSLAAHVSEFIAAGINLVSSIIQGIANGIGPIIQNIIAPILNIIKNLIVGIVEAIAPYIPTICDAFTTITQVVSNAIVQIIQAIAPFIPNIQAMVEAVSSAVQSICGAFIALLQQIVPIVNSITQLIQQLGDSISQILRGVADVIVSCGEAIQNALDGIAGIFDSVFGGISDVISSVGESIRNVLDGIADIIESIGEAALNAGTGFENLANGVKTITNLNLVDMAASMAAVATGIGKIAKQSDGLAEAGTGMKQIADGTSLSASAFNTMAAGVSIVVSSLSTFSSLAGTINSAITSMANGIINSQGQIASMLSYAIANIKNYYIQFVVAGLHLVNGFAKGISDNTFIAEAKAKAMANKAYEAAKKALDEHSPSKKFMKVGAFAVAGFAKGITKNVGDATKAAIGMSKGVLEATQDALGIHSPSVVFDKKVGRYTVQGIAEGIKKDMSAEEAAEKKAQNIVSAFQNELDRIERRVSNREKGFNLWKLTDGKAASDAAIVHKQMQQLNDDLYDYNEKAKLAKGEWETFSEMYGPNSKYTEEAYGKMLDAQIKAAETASELIAVQDSLITSEEELAEKRISINKKKAELLESQKANGKLITDAEIDKANLSAYKIALDERVKMVANAQQKYDKLLNDAAYGPNHKETLVALDALMDARSEEENAKAELFNYEQSIYDRNIEKLEDQITRNESENKLWELIYGENSSNKNRYIYYKNQYEEDANNYRQAYRAELKRYNDFVKDYASKNYITEAEAKASEEAKKQWDKVREAQIKAEEARKKVRDNRKEYLENEREDLETQYELTSDIADLKYQIWEKTNGRKATDVEKNTMKLAFLSEQVGAQAKLVKLAKDAWSEATGDDKQQKEKEYYQAQLELTNLQSEVLDIQEENIKRQEKALDKQRNSYKDYEDYIKKYEKYYLEHGMTKEELEKDARLVSGYDPNNAVKSMVSKTTTALNNLKSNTQYNGLLSSFSEMGTSYASAVSDGIQNGTTTIVGTTSSLVKACVDKIDSEKDSWIKAGTMLVEKFIEGIKSKIQASVDTATELASRTLEAIRNVCDGNMDYSPTIRPVLDMSDVSSKASSLNSIFSANRSLKLATSIPMSSASSSNSRLGSTTAKTSGATYSFVQNNYSPKALSSIEIYRQTNNVISKIGKKV